MAQLNFNSVFEGLPKLVLSLSLLHLSACVLFILGYGFGFSGNIISLFGPGDIFSVGLKDLSNVYITAIAVPALIKLYRLTSDKPYLQDRFETISDPAERTRALNDLEIARKWILRGYYATLVILMGAAIYGFWQKNPFSYLLVSWAIFFAVVVEQNKIKSILKIDHKLFEAFDLIIIVYVSSLAYGAQYGALDRGSTFRRISAGTIHCDQFAILRSVSSYFIAVRRDDKKFMIDNDCKVVFSFEPSDEGDLADDGQLSRPLPEEPVEPPAKLDKATAHVA